MVITDEDKITISEAIETLNMALDEFGKMGYAETEERENALRLSIDTLQMIMKGDLF